GATGSIDLSPSGGTPPYAYAWTTSDGAIPAGQADDQDLTGLVAGTYNVVITDANGTTGGCRATNGATITQPAAALSSTKTSVDVLCYGGATGSIDLSPSGGTPPYAYAWTTSDGAIPAGQADDQDLTGLVAGTYNVVITDANGTTGGCRATNGATITQPAAALSSTKTSVDVLCYGGATGSIDLSPSGGTPPYAYAWTTSDGAIPAGQADDQDLTGLVAGTYNVVITDANGTTGGCRATNGATITQPAAALSSTKTSVDVLCYGGATGSIDLSPSGGTPPYAYAWTTSDGAIPAGQADDQDLTGLVAGTYSVVITDANGTTGGCRATNGATITQPAAALSSTKTSVDVLCYGGATGSIDLSPSGGTPP
ncbi:SprB repeat-containing protein, partial [Flavobacterium sp. GSP11]